MQAPLRAHFSDLPAVDMKEVLQQRMFEDKSYLAHEDHNNLLEALEKSLERDYSNQLLSDLEEAHKKKRNKAPSSSKTVVSTPPSMAWTTSDTRFESASVSAALELSPTYSLMNDDSILDEQASALVSSYEPPAENSLLAKIGDMTTFMNWYCQKFQMEECHKMLTDQINWANLEGDQVRIDVNRPLPLGGPPGHVTIQTQFFFNKDLGYLRYGNKGSSPALSISKMKAARYPDFGLELLVLEQMWIDDVCTYDISAKYGISHWWFNRQKFYIDRHDSLSRRKEVRTHMRILSVVRIKAYSRYEYDYLSEIVLRRADYQEHTIAEKDFKNLYPSDFEDLNLFLLQGHLDHLPGSNKRMLSTVVKLWTRNLVIRQRVEDF
ncbi:hypothetical protein Tco_0295042 [Tanacetum coccineum]